MKNWRVLFVFRPRLSGPQNKGRGCRTDFCLARGKNGLSHIDWPSSHNLSLLMNKVIKDFLVSLLLFFLGSSNTNI